MNKTRKAGKRNPKTTSPAVEYIDKKQVFQALTWIEELYKLWQKKKDPLTSHVFLYVFFFFLSFFSDFLSLG